MPVMARVESLKPGDEVKLSGSLGWCTVVDVLERGDAFIVLYEDDVEHAWETRAHDTSHWPPDAKRRALTGVSHWSQTRGWFVKSLRPLREGERWPTRRA